MMNRRKFMATAGASAALLPVPSAFSLSNPGPPVSTPHDTGRLRISLAGEWDRYFAGALYDRIPVPSSQRPLGSYSLQRSFVLPRLSARQRAILHFDAVNYYSQASVNGSELGSMGPYLPYEFDFTSRAKKGSNQLNVDIVDLGSGPNGEGEEETAMYVYNAGWEACGGIIRDVYVEVRPSAFIDNVKFGYTLNSDYTQANCQATVFVSSHEAGPAQVEVSLEQGQSEVAHAEKSFQATSGLSEVRLQLEVRAPELWSPEAPNLCELKVRLRSEAGEDQWSTRTGFREVKIAGNQFLLNGQPLVLKGVCRHDMWKGQGFTLTRAQMEQDMRMIKELGCNFVRLVHYPHHRRIIELADEWGLLVSEEPGYWGMDFTTMSRSMIELGYNIMERTIQRDWNSPSVFAWLLGNECKLTVDFLREGKKRCRRLDPLGRPVSFAGGTAGASGEQTKAVYEQAGMDFFDAHIYTFDINQFRKTAEYYGMSKPFTVTEWGAMVYGQSRPVMEHTVDTLIELTNAKQMAGHSFWEWADMIQFSREGWMMHNGVLTEGVVTQSRDPREEVYGELARLFERRLEGVYREPIRPTLVPLKRPVASPHSLFTPVDLQSLIEGTDASRSWSAFKESMAKYWAGVRMARNQWQMTGEKFVLWKVPQIRVAGIPFRMPVVDNHVRPLILTPEVPKITIPLNLSCVRLHILGQVTFPEGFPVIGQEGELVATYLLRYTNGTQQKIPVRNGREVAQSNLIYLATRINPVAADAQRAMVFVKDVAREHYQALLWPVPTGKGILENLHCELEAQQPSLAIFAITAERES